MINCLWFVPKEIKKNKLLKDLEKIWYMIFLFLYSLGSVFMRELTYNNILLFLVIAFVVETLLTLKLYIDIREVLLFAGFLSFYLTIEDVSAWQISFIFLLSYMIMKQFILCGGKLYKRRVIQIFVIVGICLCMFGILETSSIYHRPIRANNNIYINRQGHIKYFHDNTLLYNLTHWTIYLIPVISLIVYSIINFRKTPIISVIILCLSSICTYLSFYIDLRNSVVITIIIAFLAIIIHFIKNRKSKRITVLYFALCIIGVFFLLCLNKYISTKELLNNDTWSRNGGFFGNIRFKWQVEVLRNLLYHPRGGYELADSRHAHNLWLDIAKDAGIAPFTMLFILLIISIKDMIIYIIHCRPGDNGCVFLPMIFCAYTLYNVVEPTVYSVTMYLPLYYMTSAAVRAMNIRVKWKCSKKKRERISHEK